MPSNSLVCPRSNITVATKDRETKMTRMTKCESLAWDDWISSLQWPNWPSYPGAIIRRSPTSLDSQQFACSWIYSQNWDMRGLIDDKGPRCGKSFLRISAPWELKLLYQNNLFRFQTQLRLLKEKLLSRGLFCSECVQNEQMDFTDDNWKDFLKKKKISIHIFTRIQILVVVTENKACCQKWVGHRRKTTF